MNSLIGQTLAGRYRIIAAAGRGGMAEVYKVLDTQRAVHLAMKVLREDIAEDKVFLRRFKREAQTLGQLQHPNIVRFYGLEQDGSLAFMLMDFVDGISLRKEIFNRSGPFPVQRVLEIMKATCAALGYAHNLGMVHCDVKPGNIMFESTGKVLVTDFGIARMTDAATATMVGFGTPAYMAPELVQGKDPTPQSDIYSLGVLLFEMLSGGERPFTGEHAKTTGSTSEKVRWEQVHLPPPSLRKLSKHISPELDAVVLKCLAKDPQERYPSSLDLLNALVAASGEPEAKPAVAAKAEVAEEIPLPAAIEAAPLPEAWHAPPSAAASQASKRRKSKALIWGIIVPIIAAVLVVGGYFLFQQMSGAGLFSRATPTSSFSTQPPSGLATDSPAISTDVPVSATPMRADAAVIRALSSQCTFNVYRMGWVMDWADAGNIVDTVLGPRSHFQYTFWQVTNPQEAVDFEALTYRAYRDNDLVSRASIWQDAEDVLVDELVTVIPLFHYDRTTLVSNDVDYMFPPFGAPRIAQWQSRGGTSTLSTALSGPVHTLDISQTSDTTSLYVLTQLYDAPYRYNPDGSIAPLAATGFDVSSDGKTFTIHLRRYATWSDGSPVTADQFADAIYRVLDPETPGDYAYVLFDIVGAGDYASGNSDSIEGLRAVNDHTLEITLNDALAYFDSILALHVLSPVRTDLIELMPNTWTKPGLMVGNGAYVLTQHNPGESLVLEVNPRYWNIESVDFDRVEMAIIPEAATCLAAFEAGQLDHAGCGMPTEDIPYLSNTPEFVVTPRPGVYYYGFNTAAPHTDNVTFRKAL
ncbi:MAG: ABC transporter substrate-binding protein, partial [Anaerolineales bacterium]